MNTLAVISILAVMLSVVTGLGYNSYNSYNGYPSNRGSVLNSWGSNRWGSLNNGGWNVRHGSNYRRKRAAVGYGSHVPYYGNRFGSHIGSTLNSGFGGLGSNLGWGVNSGRGMNRWSRYGY